MNLLELLHESVLAHSNKESIRYKSGGLYRSITYQELWESIMHVAIGLQTCSVVPGEKVAILSTNCPEWAISDYAILAIGAVVVPIYPTLPADQVEFILQNAEVQYVIAQDLEQYRKIQSYASKHVKRVILINDHLASIDGRVLSFSDLMNIGKQQAPSTGHPDIHKIVEHQLATIVHTSGTSGTPKGVMLTHRNIVTNIRASLSYLPVEKTDVTLSYLPLSHIFERTAGQFAALSCGATIAYAESIETIQQNLQEVRPTILVTVPRLLEKVYAKMQHKLEQAPTFLRKPLQKTIQGNKTDGLAYRLVDHLLYKKIRAGLGGRIRSVVSGGAGLAADIAIFFQKAGITVYEGYGMTEASPVICSNQLGQSKPGTVGRPIPGVEIRIAEDGELLVKGPNVMQGYYRSPEETAKAITSDGWLLTGDIAEINEGYVKIVDRKKNILVLATGKNIAPWPIENAITLSPYISEAIVIGDERPYVTCLLVPAFDAIREMAKEWNLGDREEEWIQQPVVRNTISSEVMRMTKAFSDFERPKRAVLLRRELTLEAGELTPTLKVRNKAILQNYGHLVEAMYSGTNYIPLSAPPTLEQSSSYGEPTPPTLAAASGQDQSVNPEKDATRKKHPVWGYAILGMIMGLAIRIWSGR